MLVATFNYDLFQRADVLRAAESSNALRPALKDSVERGKYYPGDTIESIISYKNPASRQTEYKTSLIWHHR